MMANDNNNDTATFTRHSSDTMKEPDERPMTAIDMPDKIETEKTPADDAQSKEDDPKKQAKKEKEGSLKDYFVSHNSGSIFSMSADLTMCSAFSRTQVRPIAYSMRLDSQAP